MQPLKRFTQCGSLTMLFAVFIVLFGVSSTALTTFGKSNPNNAPPPPTLPPIKGKECSSHVDCIALQHASCVIDPNDDRLRCLCGDNHPPINGYCATTTKGLRHLCTDIVQCDEGMICAIDNSTRTALGIRTSTSQKICLCDDEGGFVEKHRTCNGAISTFTGIFVPILALILGALIAKQN